MYKTTRQEGFSLVELSIVLVILGLLTGGILSGQSLIRASEVRNLLVKTENYRMAVLSFRGKYNQLPGDFSMATDFWGSQDGAGGNTNACSTTAGTGTQTCNGNGNGDIEPHNAGYVSESILAWEHLANAGLVEGSYNGLGGGATNTRSWHIPGTNSPILLGQATVLIASRTFTLGSEEFPLNYYASNWFRIAANLNSVVANTTPQTPILTPAEQWGLDVKMDDGKPGSGVIRGTINSSTWGPECSTTDDAATAEYNVQLESKVCFVDFYFR